MAGQPVRGQVVSATNGSWSGGPTAFGYQWRRCDAAGASCADIAGATGATYLLAAAYVGSTMRVRVSASNGAGSGPWLLASMTMQMSSGAALA